MLDGFRHPTHVVPALDMEVRLQQRDDRQVGFAATVRQRGRIEEQPIRRAPRRGDLVDQAGFASPRFAHNRHHAAVARLDAVECAAQLCDLDVAADEATQSLRLAHLEPGAQRPDVDELVDVERAAQPLDRHQTHRLDDDVALGQAERLGGQQNTAGACELLHARRQVGGLTHGCVVDLQIVRHRPRDDLAGVQSDADLDVGPIGRARDVGISPHRLLHGKRGIARPDRMILLCPGCAEEGHDPVAHHLVHGAFVPAHRLDHPLEHGIQDAAHVLRIAISQQLQ